MSRSARRPGAFAFRRPVSTNEALGSGVPAVDNVAVTDLSAAPTATKTPLRAAVIGAGPAGLMAAEVLAQNGTEVTVYDHMPSVGRKLLMAGRGGLNLTHSEPFELFMTRYGAAAPRLRAAIEAFPPAALRAWCEALGQPTFVGSSGRVFPVALKASPLLRAWLRRLDRLGVTLAPRHRWRGWTDRGGLAFDGPNGPVEVNAGATVLALGGASWPRLGSDGGWTEILRARGIVMAPLRPANCGFRVDWTDVFAERFAGAPLKTIAVKAGGQESRGEIVITRDGVEGGGIYALSAPLRDVIARDGVAELRIALRPDLDAAAIENRLSTPRGKQTLTNFLRKVLSLSPVAIGLMQEASLAGGRSLTMLSVPELAALVDGLPLRLTGTAPLVRAISSAGGIALVEADEGFMLRQRPGVFVAGEMLDWEAPTGGYLLQACFATGAAAGRAALDRLKHSGRI